jgi:hypothetical protein
MIMRYKEPNAVDQIYLNYESLYLRELRCSIFSFRLGFFNMFLKHARM